MVRKTLFIWILIVFTLSVRDEGMQETHRVTKLDINVSIQYEHNTINSK